MTSILSNFDPILKTYACILLGMLALAGLALAGFTFVLRRDVRSVWVTWRAWLIMIPLVLVAIALGPVWAVAFFTLVALVGFKEFARATGLYRDWSITAAVYLGIIAVGITCLVPDPNNGARGWYGLFMALPVFVIAFIVLVPVVRDKTHGQLQAMALAVLGFIYVGWMFLHVALIASHPSLIGYLLYLLFAVEVNDIAAFTFGRLLGKNGRHPFRIAISPKKTWEGALGALAVSMILPWIMRFSFPEFGTTQLILTGLIVGVGGQLGDLGMSVIKRDIGVKDMGGAIPGHGGVLDRIDSLVYTAPLFLHMVDYYYKHW
jgi:phosphatidate cytidylyltransferase